MSLCLNGNMKLRLNCQYEVVSEKEYFLVLYLDLSVTVRFNYLAADVRFPSPRSWNKESIFM